MSCIFCQIVKKEIPSNILYEEEEAIVFPDIHPKASVHLLVVPKKHIPDFFNLADEKIKESLFRTVRRIIEKMGLEKKGYRLVVNGGGAQLIEHLHIHILGKISCQRKL